jgi:DNA-binding NtrC family response regulator
VKLAAKAVTLFYNSCRLVGTEQTISVRRTSDGTGGCSPAPGLFFVLCADSPSTRPSRHSLAHVKDAIIGRGDRDATRSDSTLILRFPDRQMSTQHARLSRGAGHWFLVDDRSKNGTFINGQRIDRAQLTDGDVVELGHTFWLFRAAVPGGADAPLDREGSLVAEPGAAGMSTLSADLAAQHIELVRAATSTAPIFITGETGTGKEVMARVAHSLSGRTGSFVAVNCGALPESLLESALFGHSMGAFTGAAKDELGFVRAADKGTLFLDEIGDLPLSSQPRFLRVLEQKEVTPVGSTKPLPVDIRLVAATHRDLETQVAAGDFREDLWARLAGFTIRLPALRERREDVGILAAALLASKGPIPRLTLSRDAARALMTYTWPRNIRELALDLEVAMTRCGASGEIDLRHLPECVARAVSGDPTRAEIAHMPGVRGPRPTATDPPQLPETQEEWRALPLRFPEARSMTELARLAGLAESTLRARRNKHGWPDLFSRSPRRRR